MKGANYYPAGAYYDSNAPYNQPDPEEINFNVRVTAYLERVCDITTDEAYFDRGKVEVFEGSSMRNIYHYNYYDIPYLLNELVKYVEGELIGGDISKSRELELKKIRDSALGWEWTDYDFEKP